VRRLGVVDEVEERLVPVPFPPVLRPNTELAASMQIVRPAEAATDRSSHVRAVRYPVVHTVRRTAATRSSDGTHAAAPAQSAELRVQRATAVGRMPGFQAGCDGAPELLPLCGWQARWARACIASRGCGLVQAAWMRFNGRKPSVTAEATEKA
jgi:hypothetical protein